MILKNQTQMQRFSDNTEPLIPGMVKINPIIHKFKLTEEQELDIRSVPYKFGFGTFGEVVFNRTYSRKVNGVKEMFPDVVVRVINGILSIRKNHYISRGLEWNDSYWSNEAVNIGKTMMKMHFLPPGRGLYMCGTDYSYMKGGAAFNNCGFISTKDDLLYAATWTMDSLMCGCGIGFDTRFKDEGQLKIPGCAECRFEKNSACGCGCYEYVIHDSREGWVKSLRLLLKTYFTGGPVVHFDYSELRNKGEELKGFGGVSSGYKPLKELHNRVRSYMECYFEAKEDPFSAILNMCTRDGDEQSFAKIIKIRESDATKTYGTSRLIVDIFNAIGICVVAGNIRRSSEISLGEYGDDEFLNLKNYALNPERESIGWMSNNTVIMSNSQAFEGIPDITNRIKTNGEPGIFNAINAKKYGRVGKKNPIGRENEEDMVEGLNPCLTGDTMIKTTEGLQPITSLIGKQFTAVVNGDNFNSTDAGFWSSGIKDVFLLTLENGMSIKATINHKFFEEYKGEYVGWVTVEELSAGDKLILDEWDTSAIVSIEPAGQEEVYDCTIPGKHCFLANGIISHNCGEIALESGEYCCLSEIFLSRCETFDEMVNAAKIATFYASTISLLPTHWAKSNSIISRNHRIGVSISGIADFHDKFGFTDMTNIFKSLYKIVRSENKRLAIEAGVPESIRVTTVKPSGTISLIAGVSPGIHFPAFSYAIRTIRISADSELVPLLKNAGVKCEPDFYSGPGTLVFSFPIYQGTTRSAQNVSIWEQAMLQVTLQREWADNGTSCTLCFNPETEGDVLENVIAQITPLIKGLSCLPHTDEGVYIQAPYQKITKEEYKELCREIKPIQWDTYSEEAVLIKGCDGDTCDFNSFKLSTKN